MRVLLEGYVGRGIYVLVEMDDGQRLQFCPAGVTCKPDAAGNPVWMAVGVAYDPARGGDDYAASAWSR